MQRWLARLLAPLIGRGAAVRKPVVEELEPRILYSADANPLLWAGTDPNAGAVVAPVSTEQSAQAVDAPAQQQEQRRREIVFVDAAVPDAQKLIDGILGARSDDADIEVVQLRADANGLQQISDVLAGEQNVDAVHIVSHGEAGRLWLGNGLVDARALQQHTGFGVWQSALTADADVLLWGCDVAAGTTGEAFVQQFASLTGADVAASTNDTGSAERSADWTLEFSTGGVVPRNTLAAAGWDGVLATFTVTTTADSGAGSLRQAILNANANAGADIITFSIAGTGVHTISLTSALPTITEAVTIDATTDDSWAANGSKPAIELNGTSAGAGVVGLNLTSSASSSTIRGLAINRFTSHGILLNGADNVTIAGNHIGVGTTGLTDLGNGANGIQLINGAQNNTIGGLVAADRNVISGNTNAGVAIDSSTSTGNLVIGNYIGVGADGSTSVGNTDDGVHFNAAGINNTVGSALAGGRNVISSNGLNGVGASDTAGVIVVGNYIGTDATGLVARGNAGAGVQFWSGSTVTSGTVGGTATGEGNLIANNTGDGVYVRDATVTGVKVLGNRIVGNSGSGIDLGTSGVTANDGGDGDSGPNGYQNFPVLSSAASASAGTTVIGTLNSNANTTYRIEFFSTRPAADDATHGEGDRYLGFVTVTTDGAGNASFNTLLANAWVNSGDSVSATATVDLGGGNYGSTSEFAANVSASSNGVIVVDTTSEILDGTTTSIANLGANRGADGRISLREAIFAANNTANGAAPDKIVFAIGVGGSQTITVTSLLPDITGAVVIDGSTQNGFAGTPLINLSGGGTVQDGLRLYTGSSGSTIRGLVIRNFTQDGIDIASSNNNTIVGNWIGTNAAGTGVSANQQGVNVFAANNNVIGGTTAADRNVLSGNTGQGVWIGGGSTGNQVLGNYIGTNAAGTAAVANTNVGVTVVSANNTIGGTAAGAGNVISGNSGIGVNFDGSAATGNTVAGNVIGLNAAGTALLGNGSDGVYIVNGASSNTIGGATTAHRNVISGNSDGVQIGGTAGSNSNIVRNNYIGTDVTGTVDLGNNDDGIDIDNGGLNNQVIGNLIAGNSSDGIDLGDAGASTGTVIQGNWIGTQANGSSALGNSGHGILIGNGGTANNTTIGGVTAGQGNTIAFSGGDGIYVAASTSVSILGNAIYGNAGLGIDLGPDGVTRNDAGDADSGANNLQNALVLTAVRTNGAGLIEVTGSLNSTVSTAYRLEFFASTSPDATGYGEGQRYLGYLDTGTDTSGNLAGTAALNFMVASGEFVSVTTTRTEGTYTTFYETSEFSPVVMALSVPLNDMPGAQSTNEDTTRVFSTANGNAISIADVDAGGAANQVTLSVTNGTLTLAGTAGLTFVAGDGTDDATMTVRGTAAAINTALNGLAYAPTANYTGSATLTLATKDSTLLSLDIGASLLGRYAFESTGALGTDTSPARATPAPTPAPPRWWTARAATWPASTATTASSSPATSATPPT